jgi:hypothetical protein
MNTRPRDTTIWQFGSQEWLMKRASFPPTAASITHLRLTVMRKVWWRSMAASS